MRKLCFLLFIFISTFTLAQQGVTYHVNSKLLNFRLEPRATSPIMYYLNQYENIKVLDSNKAEGWARIKHYSDTGYVSMRFITRGSCIVNTYDIKVGVRCRDGRTFGTLNKNICASHGGFAYWLTEPLKSVHVIIND